MNNIQHAACIITLLSLNSCSLHSMDQWHAWSVVFEAREKIMDKHRKIEWDKERRMKEMFQFRLGQHDPQSPINTLPKHIINHIHYMRKALD